MVTWCQTSSAESELPGLLVAGKDKALCERIAGIFAGSEYRVTVTSSASEAAADVLEGTARVVLIGDELDGCRAGEIVPLLKKCNPDLGIILVSGDAPVPLLRKLRREGIFYHALQPTDADGVEELREAVRCAFGSLSTGESTPPPSTGTENERRAK